MVSTLPLFFLPLKNAIGFLESSHSSTCSFAVLLPTKIFYTHLCRTDCFCKSYCSVCIYHLLLNVFFAVAMRVWFSWMGLFGCSPWLLKLLLRNVLFSIEIFSIFLLKNVVSSLSVQEIVVYLYEGFLSSQEGTGQSVQCCCSSIFSLWVLLLDSTVGRLLFCRRVTEAACCWM